MKKNCKLLCFVVILSMITKITLAATGEVTKSGSTWTSKVDGSTKYTGTDMIDAINACCSNMGSGTINIRNSGDAVAPNGLRSVNIQSNQTLDFHGTTMNCNNALNIYPVKGSNKSNVTVKNLNITGVPRYLLHFSGCSGVNISNITANTTRGTGIRVETSSNLVISGNIDLHTPGHCIETYTVSGVDIGVVTVQSDNGCGVLFNDSENCNVDEIWAYNCDTGGSYAGFRQANNNGTTYCGYLRAKNCGRGLYVLTSSHATTVNNVDIDDCTTSGISVATTGYNVRVNSGTVSNTPKAVDIWDGASDVCIKVNGGSYGDACGSSGGGSSDYYSITNRNSNKCISVENGSSSDNANVEQQSCNSSSWRQNWELVDLGNGYLQIKNRNSGKCMRASGSNVVQYTCYDTYWTEMFTREDAGSGYYLIRNRNTNTCLRVENSSSSDGASIVLSSCNSGYWSQQFSFTSLKSAPLTSEKLTIDGNVTIYPTLVKNILNIDLFNGVEGQTLINVFNNTGKLILSENLDKKHNIIDLTKLPSGIYIIKLCNDKEVVNKKIIKE